MLGRIVKISRNFVISQTVSHRMTRGSHEQVSKQEYIARAPPPSFAFVQLNLNYGYSLELSMKLLKLLMDEGPRNTY